jgi:predicted GTPase
MQCVKKMQTVITRVGANMQMPVECWRHARTTHNIDKATNTCIEIVNEFIEEVKKICKLEEDFQQTKTKNKNLLIEIVGGRERNYW